MGDLTRKIEGILRDHILPVAKVGSSTVAAIPLSTRGGEEEAIRAIAALIAEEALPALTEKLTQERRDAIEAEIAGKSPLERWERNAGVSTLADLRRWAEAQQREVLTLRSARADDDGPANDDLEDYLVGKQAALSGFLANMRQIEERSAQRIAEERARAFEEAAQSVNYVVQQLRLCAAAERALAKKDIPDGE